MKRDLRSCPPSRHVFLRRRRGGVHREPPDTEAGSLEDRIGMPMPRGVRSPGGSSRGVPAPPRDGRFGSGYHEPTLGRTCHVPGSGMRNGCVRCIEITESAPARSSDCKPLQGFWPRSVSGSTTWHNRALRYTPPPGWTTPPGDPAARGSGTASISRRPGSRPPWICCRAPRSWQRALGRG